LTERKTYIMLLVNQISVQYECNFYHVFCFQDISFLKETFKNIDIGETLIKIQADIAALKTDTEKPGDDYKTVLTDLKQQNTAAVKVIHDVKDVERRIKRGFEGHKRYFGEQVRVLHTEVTKLDQTLSDVNKTFASLVPELKVNFENVNAWFKETLTNSQSNIISLFSVNLDTALESTKAHLSNITTTFARLGNNFNETLTNVGEIFENANAVFKETLTNSQSNIISMFSVNLDTALESTKAHLSNITITFARLGNNFNETLTNVEENVKKGIEASLSRTLDEKLNYFKSSILSEFTNIQEKIKSVEATGILTNIFTGHIYFNTSNGYLYPVFDAQSVVRLANTTIEEYGGMLGRLEVYHGGRWGTVCDDHFEDVDARVACAMFSQSPVADARAYGKAYSGPGTGPIWLDDVACSGTESSIFDCGHNGFAVKYCHHGEDVAIDCRWKNIGVI